MTAAELGRFIDGKVHAMESRDRNGKQPLLVRTARRQAVFQILERVTNFRKSSELRDALPIVRRSWALIRSGDNLAISIEEPWKYSAGAEHKGISALRWASRYRFDDPHKEAYGNKA